MLLIKRPHLGQPHNRIAVAARASFGLSEFRSVRALLRGVRDTSHWSESCCSRDLRQGDSFAKSESLAEAIVPVKHNRLITLSWHEWID
jgi:hypothetical protein